MSVYPMPLQTLLLESIEQVEEILDRMKRELTTAAMDLFTHCEDSPALVNHVEDHHGPNPTNLWDMWNGHLRDQYIHEAVEFCYNTIQIDHAINAMGHDLTPSDFEFLKNRHRDYLQHLLSSPFPSSPGQAVGLQRGKALFVEGWPAHIMLKFFQLEWQTLQRILPDNSWEHHSLRLLITKRLIRGLHLQWQAYQGMDTWRWDVLARTLAHITSFSPAPGISTDLREIFRELQQREQLTGIVLVDEQDSYHTGHVLAGAIPRRVPESLDIDSLIHQTRSEGQVIFRNLPSASPDSVHRPPFVSPRAVGLWPINPHHVLHSPVLVVFSPWPGYFSGEKTKNFWNMLRLILSHYV
ncbi:hypothetical protein [Sulfobacillus thermosulfidooxidans]|nr:hypothetical protein [Sulfobacillus thermosulfidooxidans]